MQRFLWAFIGIGLLLFGLVYLPPIREQVIAPFTDRLTGVAGSLITLFGGQVWVQGNVLTIPGFVAGGELERTSRRSEHCGTSGLQAAKVAG